MPHLPGTANTERNQTIKTMNATNHDTRLSGHLNQVPADSYALMALTHLATGTSRDRALVSLYN